MYLIIKQAERSWRPGQTPQLFWDEDKCVEAGWAAPNVHLKKEHIFERLNPLTLWALQ